MSRVFLVPTPLRNAVPAEARIAVSSAQVRSLSKAASPFAVQRQRSTTLEPRQSPRTGSKTIERTLDRSLSQGRSLRQFRVRPFALSEVLTMPLRLRSAGSTGAARRILCYGDSLTIGFFANGRLFEPYGRKMSEVLAEVGIENEVFVCGHSGRSAAEMVEATEDSLIDVVDACGKGLARILDEDGHFDLVIIMAGTNDMAFGASNQEIVRHVNDLHETCHSRGVPTLALTPPPAPRGNLQRETIRLQLVQLLRRWAKCKGQHNVVDLVDTADITPLAGASHLWDVDGIHFAAAGSIEMGRAIAATVKQFFIEKGIAIAAFAKPARQRFPSDPLPLSQPTQTQVVGMGGAPVMSPIAAVQQPFVLLAPAALASPCRHITPRAHVAVHASFLPPRLLIPAVVA